MEGRFWEVRMEEVLKSQDDTIIYRMLRYYSGYKLIN